MEGIGAAIKEAIKEELKELLDEQGKQDQRYQDLSKAVQDLSGKVVEREREAEKLSESLEKCKEDFEASAGKAQATLNEDATELKERLNKFEDDVDGMGGLKQVHEKCSSLEKALSDMQPKFDESMRLVKENTSRTEEFDRKIRELTRQCEVVTETLKASEERVASMEGISATVSVAQEALEDSVTRKYENLWEDVLHAIEEVKGGQMEVMQKDLDGQKEAAKRETRALVNYATNLMATAHGERRQMALNRGLVLAWKEQTWNGARRRMGINYLHRILQRRQRSVFDVWHRRHTTSALCDRLHGQYEGQLSDVYRVVEDGKSQVEDRCDKLDSEVAHLQEKKCSQHSLDDAIGHLQKDLKKELKAIDHINATLEEHKDVQKRHDELHRGHSDSEANLDEKITGVGQDLAEVIEGCSSYAKSEEVKGMIRDILLIWNSIKQLDTAKADKKDVDSFALETGNRDKLSIRRLEDLEADLALKSRQDIISVQEKWNEVEGRLDESGRQFRHWEQMWEKLSGFVEDLVAKIGDLQGSDNNKLPAATLRMHGRPPSRDGLTRSRAEIPTLPTAQHGGPDCNTASRATLDKGGHHHPAATENVEAQMMWINSARGMVDAAIDQAVHGTTPHSATKPRSRPKSASAPPRRPHDRAR